MAKPKRVEVDRKAALDFQHDAELLRLIAKAIEKNDQQDLLEAAQKLEDRATEFNGGVKL